jgi:hypothetical protein
VNYWESELNRLYRAMTHSDLLAQALRQPPSSIAYAIGRQLAGLAAGKAVVESASYHFDLQEFARDGHCTFRVNDEIHSQLNVDWIGPGQGLASRLENGWAQVDWNGRRLEVVVASWSEGYHQYHRYWIIADERAVAEQFLNDVCEWCHEVRGEVLVFSGGCWEKSAELFSAIRAANFDNLILHGDLKEQIQRDFRQFLAARATYEEYGVPWKRGVLLLGPAGNGKTHCVKAVVNLLARPCLYVRSLKSMHDTEESAIRQVFHRARQSVPCIVVWEDLDALITADNRSFFLNELDGFAENAGIITLATTNHPERLDPAILDRPSRFDVKYHFELPGDAERQAYFAMWNGNLKPELRVDPARFAELSQLVAGFSFAYIKELILSSIMQWIDRREPGGLGPVIERQASTLRAQMQTEPEPPPAHAVMDTSPEAHYRAMRRMYGGCE